MFEFNYILLYLCKPAHNDTKMNDDEMNGAPSSSSAQSSNQFFNTATSSNSNKNFVFLSPTLPSRPARANPEHFSHQAMGMGGGGGFANSSLYAHSSTLRNSGDVNTEFVQSVTFNKMNRPVMGSLGGASAFGFSAGAGPKSNQPELKLEELQAKKQAFYFNSDQLFAKPNELMRDTNDDLSSALDEELNNSKMDESDHFNREQSHRSSNHSHHSSGQYKQHHSHHSHHHHHSKHKSRGGKLTITKDQVDEMFSDYIPEIPVFLKLKKKKEVNLVTEQNR